MMQQNITRGHGNAIIQAYQCLYATRTCTYIRPIRAPVCNTLCTYTHSYQSKVSSAGTFTALLLMVVTKVRKLSFWRCCECYSCECCCVLFSRSLEWLLRCYYQTTRSKGFSTIDLLEELSETCSHCLTWEEHRATKVGVLKFLCWKGKTIFHQYASLSQAHFEVNVLTGIGK